MASGCPVVSSNTSSMPEVINVMEFFNPNNIDDIRFAIEKVINSDEEERLVELGYKNVNQFSWSKSKTDN